MFARNSSFLCATCPSLLSLPIKPNKSTTSSAASSQRRPKSTRPFDSRRRDQETIRTRRRYATIAARDEHDPEPPSRSHAWPKPPQGQQHPTPYQIFSMKATAPYAKSRYYELVKLYHPDLNHSTAFPQSAPSPDEPTPKTKMERYRLIVAAHAILSDPTKRAAYDRWGAGWIDRPEFHHSPPAGSHQPGPFSHSWTSPSDDPIWRNATWEDWERFYARREREQDPNADGTVSGERPTPLYMSNASFVVLVAILAVIGSSLNYNRAQDAGTYFVEQRDLVHDRAAKELRKVRQEMASLRGRDERIQFFIRQREATLGTLSGDETEALREERAERVLSDREVCRSDGTQKKE